MRKTTGKSAGETPAVQKPKASHGLTSEEVSYITTKKSLATLTLPRRERPNEWRTTQTGSAFAFFAVALEDSCSSSACFRSTPQR
jgi:hypothetical protein